MIGWMVVKQYLDKQWVELIRIESDKELSEEELKEALETMKDLIFDADKINIISGNSVVIFKRHDGPVKVEFEISDI